MKANTSKPTARPAWHPGKQIKYFQKGDTDILSASRLNELVTVCNAVSNGKVVLGSRARFSMSGRNAVWEVPRQTAAASSTGSSGFHPFKVYNPAGEAANTFRVRGGYVYVPELFPSSTTQRSIALESAFDLYEVSETDGIFYSSDDDGTDDTYDFILNNWDNGAGGHYSYYGIWLEVFQDEADPGNIAITVEGAFNQLPPCYTQLAGVDDGSTELLTVPIARIFPVGFNGDDITGGYVHQMLFSQVDHTRIDGHMKHCGEYRSDRVYFPGDVTFNTGGAGGYYLNTNSTAIINYPAGGGGLGNNWALLE